MISASVFGFMSLTLPGVRACTISCGSTRRTVTGIMAGVSGSARRSITPKGEAANLASGGIAPVATFSGKVSGVASGRPEASSNFEGSSMLYCVLSASGGPKLTLLTTSSSLCVPPSLSSLALIVLPSPLSSIWEASLRVTGALNCSCIGRSGRHADCAFSRSQVNDTAKGSRTR
jgi:hypothetical protein